MKIYKLIIPSFFLILLIPVNARKITISGSGSGYQGAELKFYTSSDPITKRLRPLMSTRCDEKGAFSCEVPCNGNNVIYFKAGIFNFCMFVSGGLKYEVLLPDFISKPKAEEQNPFFIETKLIPEVVSDPQDINNLIRVFDSDYNPIFNLIAERVLYNYKRDEIPSVIEKLKKYTEVKEPQFFYDYVRCRMAMLYFIPQRAGSDYSKTAGFINDRFSKDNPAYIDLTEQMFTGYFSEIISGPLKNSFEKAIVTSSFSDLREVIFKDTKISENELADYIILLNLYNDYYKHELPGENVRRIISSMCSESSSSFIKELATIISDRMSSSLPGNAPPDFSLLNDDGKTVTLKDVRGRYVILCFAKSDDRSSLIESGVLNMWQNKYTEDLQIITILTDKDFKSAINKMKNNGFNWLFLDGSHAESLEYLYDIKMYPLFIFLDREGKIIASPSPPPSENLESMVSKLLKKDVSRSGFENR